MQCAALLQAAFFVTFPPNFGPKLASHYKPVKKRSIVRRTIRTMFGELQVRLGSIKKRIIVRRIVRSMLGELTVGPVKNGLYTHAPWEGTRRLGRICSPKSPL